MLLFLMRFIKYEDDIGLCFSQFVCSNGNAVVVKNIYLS